MIIPRTPNAAAPVVVPSLFPSNKINTPTRQHAIPITKRPFLIVFSCGRKPKLELWAPPACSCARSLAICFPRWRHVFLRGVARHYIFHRHGIRVHRNHGSWHGLRAGTGAIDKHRLLAALRQLVHRHLHEHFRRASAKARHPRLSRLPSSISRNSPPTTKPSAGRAASRGARVAGIFRSASSFAIVSAAAGSKRAAFSAGFSSGRMFPDTRFARPLPLAILPWSVCNCATSKAKSCTDYGPGLVRPPAGRRWSRGSTPCQ